MLVYFKCFSFRIFLCSKTLPLVKFISRCQNIYMSMLISFFIHFSVARDYPKFITTRFSVYFVYYHILVLLLFFLTASLRVVSFVLLFFFWPQQVHFVCSTLFHFFLSETFC
uniref:(northern house mosquito) hypothetical protein n=1 Tax=Culex pipiens TaxID=7175 RepID=A0A8D8GN87_CULPI